MVKFFKNLFLIVLFFTALSLLGCATLKHADTVPGTVHHVIICWLIDPGNGEARQELIDVSSSFSALPGVIDMSAGQSLPSERKIVDSSFDVAIVITFRDKNALAEYLENPEHLKAVDKTLKPLVKKIVVYDFIEK